VPGDKRLVAYVVTTGGEPLRINKLRAFLKEKLPDYMVPSTFVTVDALPVTLNGKVDRKALPAPDRERPDLEAGFTAARTPGEKVLAQIWADVLKLERVGINDNFFDLGGDSILGTQILARATKAGLRMTPKQLFQYQTIAGLSRAMGPGAPAASTTEMKSSRPDSDGVRKVAAAPHQTGPSQEDIDKVLAQIKGTSGGRPHVN
jgi:hypothetical protein